MELSRVGELSLAELLQDARVTLHWLPCKCVVENKKKCVSGRVTLALGLPYLNRALERKFSSWK